MEGEHLVDRSAKKSGQTLLNASWWVLADMHAMKQSGQPQLSQQEMTTAAIGFRQTLTCSVRACGIGISHHLMTTVMLRHAHPEDTGSISLS